MQLQVPAAGALAVTYRSDVHGDACIEHALAQAEPRLGKSPVGLKRGASLYIASVGRVNIQHPIQIQCKQNQPCNFFKLGKNPFNKHSRGM
jgi:hypothetical protein